MVRNNRWLVAALSAGAALAYVLYRRRDLRRLVENFRRYSMPDASLYDAISAPAFGGFFSRVARDLAESAARANVLEVGSGPGRLAVKLAELASDIQVTGVDISPEMVERANARAARSGLADRVEFLVGDVTALSFPDASFDVVVSTFSLHHWPNPARGLAEIYRVLRPGGVARIYDVVDWIRRFEQGGAGIADLAADSPFGNRGSWTRRVTARLGPIPLVYHADLRRGESNAAGDDRTGV
jgi:SAM-dependent methyltransferase